MTPQEFRSIRTRLGLTQAGIGELIGKALRTVNAYEAGDRIIPRSVEIILADVAKRERGRTFSALTPPE